jgi:transposase
MPAERLSMKKIRDVLRLTHALGMSRRKVGEATGIGRTAVTDYVQRAASAGLTWPLPDGLDDAALEQRLYPAAVAAEGARIEPDWSAIHAEMKRRGVTMTLLWQEYIAEQPQGYAYSWYCECYRAWKKGVSPTSCRRRAGRDATDARGRRKAVRRLGRRHHRRCRSSDRD